MKLTTAQLIKVFAGELLKLSQHPKYRKQMEKSKRDEKNKEILKNYNKQPQDLPTPKTPLEKKIIDKFSKPKKAVSISDADLEDYLEQWYNEKEFTDFKLAIDRGLLDYAAYLIEGAGAIDPRNSDNPEIEEAIIKRLEKYDQTKIRRDMRKMLTSVEIWINDETNENYFIDLLERIDLPTDSGLTFDSGYDENGKQYNTSVMVG